MYLVPFLFSFILSISHVNNLHTGDHAKKILFKNIGLNLTEKSASNNSIFVTAATNRVEKESTLDTQTAFDGLRTHWENLARILPLFTLALLVFVVTSLLAKFSTNFCRKAIGKRLPSHLLRELISKGLGVLIFLIGFSVVFQILGLTTVALTLLGSTGAIGIILGIAFRDTTENLLASIFLSIHQPFHKGDLVYIAGIRGYVEQLTTHSTFLLSPDGNQIQIPNAMVYKSTIWNFNVNPHSQVHFTLAIDGLASISLAQAIALKVLSDHPALLKDPKPCVLVDNFENGKITLAIYFWIDTGKYSSLKVKSSVLRQIKVFFEQEEISIADHPIRGKSLPGKKENEASPIIPAEGNLRSEAVGIEKQALQLRTPNKQQEDLLK